MAATYFLVIISRMARYKTFKDLKTDENLLEDIDSYPSTFLEYIYSNMKVFKGNDDSIIMMKNTKGNLQIMKKYFYNSKFIWKNLNIELKEKKSFLSKKGGVFFEEYSHKG